MCHGMLWEFMGWFVNLFGFQDTFGDSIGFLYGMFGDFMSYAMFYVILQLVFDETFMDFM